MDWSSEVTLEFLKLYEQEPVIWNPNDSQHRNRTAVHEAWQKIENSLSIECSIADLKKKKESLMASYRSILNKVKARQRLGLDNEEVYKPSWFAFQTMASFLRDIYQPRNTLTAEEYEEIKPVGEMDQNENDIEFVKTEITENTHTFSKSVTTENSCNTFLNKEVRKRRSDEPERIENGLVNTYKTAKSVCGKSDEEECDLYANLLAAKLRKFDENTRDILMHEIDYLIFKTKMQHRNVNYQPFRVDNY